MPIRLLWPLVLLLAAFVLFLEFIAEVGGSPEPPAPAPQVPIEDGSTPTSAPFPDTGTLPQATVQRVIDGSSVQLSLNGNAVAARYYGADAPGRGERCFGAAKEANQDLVEGETVRLLAGTLERDESGLLLRYVFLEDGQSVEGRLVSQGVARASSQEGPYRQYFTQLEEVARTAALGCLWAP